MTRLEPLMQQNFLEYASYVIVDRAIPDIRDGCKPVQRRLLHTLFVAEDGKFHKVANIIGESMKLHPHGDASIGEALVVLANKEYFIEKQGNFGNILTGHSAAAARYIECRLTPLAKDTLFNPALTRFAPSYDGRRDEPVYLPAKLPVVLMLGTEGIAVGMATKILPHNFCELLKAQIRCLQGKRVALYPDFLQGGAMDVSEYADGRGKVKVRAKLEPSGDKKVIIHQIPFSTTTESVIASIENAIQKGKVKVSSIHDFTTDHIEIELTLARGAYAEEVIPQLFAYTDCEVSISSNLVVIRDRHPAELKISEVLTFLTEQLRRQVEAELQHELGRLGDRQHGLTLERIFIENRVYKHIETASTAGEVDEVVRRGMLPFAGQFVRPLEAADIERLLELRIRRISAFDIDKNRRELKAILEAIGGCNTKLKNLTQTTVTYLEDLLKKYGPTYPRRTKLTTFVAVDLKKVAPQDIRLSYDPDSGFFGSDVRGSQYPLLASEYDLVLAVADNGTYRVMSPQPKVLVGNLLHCAMFDPEVGLKLTVVYRDAKRIPWAKHVHIQKFVRNREYRLLADPQAKVDHLVLGAPRGKLKLMLAAGARLRPKAVSFDLKALEQGSLTAKGVRLASRAVSKVEVTGAS
jgi:topoisomerase-4 subunit A